MIEEEAECDNPNDVNSYNYKRPHVSKAAVSVAFVRLDQLEAIYKQTYPDFVHAVKLEKITRIHTTSNMPIGSRFSTRRELNVLRQAGCDPSDFIHVRASSASIARGVTI